MRVIIKTNGESVEMEFTNPKTAQQFHDQVKSQAVFMGKWLESITLEQPKPKKAVNKND